MASVSVFSFEIFSYLDFPNIDVDPDLIPIIKTNY